MKVLLVELYPNIFYMRVFTFLFAFFFGSYTVRSQVPAYVSTESLVAFYDFNGNANDKSLSANHGTVTGAVLTNDRASNPNSAYSFSGSAFIEVPSGTVTTLNVQSDFSLSFWFKTSMNGSPGFICFGDNISGTGGFLTGMNAGGISGDKLCGWSVSPWFGSTLTINDGLWHNAFLSKNNGTLTLYIDTVYQASEDNANVNSSWGGTRSIGSWNNFSGGFFDGAIDEVGVWNRVLTTCERKALFIGMNSVVSLSTSAQVICNGSSATLFALGSGNYTWQPGGSNSSSIVVTPSTSTIYTVSATSTITGCTTKATTSIQVVTCAGIEDAAIFINDKFKVYPSLFDEELTIHNVNEKRVRLNVFDSKSKMLLSQEIEGDHTISTTDFIAGVYFFTISVDGVILKKGKLIKMNLE